MDFQGRPSSGASLCRRMRAATRTPRKQALSLRPPSSLDPSASSAEGDHQLSVSNLPH